jgi:hypothetical protein
MGVPSVLNGGEAGITGWHLAGRSAQSQPSGPQRSCTASVASQRRITNDAQWQYGPTGTPSPS